MKELLDYLNKNGIVCECNGCFDYVLNSWLSDPKRYSIWNTYFYPEQVKQIIFEQGKYPIIILQ